MSMIVIFPSSSFISWLLETENLCPGEFVHLKWFSVNMLLAGDGLGDHARSLHHSVALSEVSPPHVLIGDLDDVSHGEPALLTVWQADAFIAAWEGRGRRGGSGRRGGRRTREDWRFLYRSCKKVKQINKLLRWKVEDRGSYKDQGV